MKAGLLTSSISRKGGGLLQAVSGLGRALRVAGLPPEVFAPEDELSHEDSVLWHPLRPHTFRVMGPESFGYAPGLLEGLQSANLDLLHVHGLWMYPSSAAQTWQRRSGRRQIISPHGMLDPWAVHRSRWKKRLAGVLFEENHLRQANCLHALCQSEAEAIRAYGLRNPICVIPNGVDLPETRSQKPETTDQASGLWPLAADRKVLLYLGRIHPKKGLDHLIKAWALVHKATSTAKTLSEWVLAIAGWDQGGHESELKKLATELGLACTNVKSQGAEPGNQKAERGFPPTVFFLGPQFNEAKAACYANCDAFILPSLSEGLPMVILEAWAYGKPVLMTAGCNLPEGFAANAALRMEPNVQSIAQSLEQLFRASFSTLDSLGANGKNLVTQRFEWPGIGRRMKEVYEWMLGGGAKPECMHAS